MFPYLDCDTGYAKILNIFVYSNMKNNAWEIFNVSFICYDSYNFKYQV
jgi:hypothetical protein